MPQIKIQGLYFTVEDAYPEGHVINADEAAALNQTRAENIRNNFAGVVQEAVDEWVKSQGLSEEDAKTATSADLPEDVKADLANRLAEYATEYKFGARRSRMVDPVEQEAMRIGREKIKEAVLRQKPDTKISDLTTAVLNKMVEKHKANYWDTWLAVAKENVARRDSAAQIEVDLADLPVAA